jgi:hypothetical protein
LGSYQRIHAKDTGVKALLLLFFALSTTATWKPEYAQMDPALRQWFNSQKNPTTSVPCCSVADGTYAEEDIRGERYWTKFLAHNVGTGEDVSSGWMEVPEDTIIRNSNRNGAPVVWYYFMTTSEGSKLYIRCFVPGGGV